MIKYKYLFLAFMPLMLIGCSCYFNNAANNGNLGVKVSNGEVDEVVSPGSLHSCGPRVRGSCEFVQISVQNQSVEIVDDDLASLDQVSLGLKVTAHFSITDNPEVIEQAWQSQNIRLRNEGGELNNIMVSKLSDSAKDVVSKMTIDQFFGIQPLSDDDRAFIASQLNINDENVMSNSGRMLSAELIRFMLQRSLNTEMGEGVIIVSSIDINNVDPSQDYRDLREQSALEEEQQKLIEEQLQTESGRNALIQQQNQNALLEAQGENEVREELADVYASNPEFYEMERLRMIAGTLDSGDLIVITDTGGNIVNVIGGNPDSNVIAIEHE